MAQPGIHIYLADWVERQLPKGVYAFSLADVKKEFPHLSDESIQVYLNRLAKKGKVLSVHKGYYIVIPPQYASRGILPPTLYLDGLMKFLQRPYYLGLLNAASLHGASHQQPQEFFVFTNFPVLRPSNKKGIKVNYISIKEVPDHLLESHKTETGYIKLSSPELTAADLVQFEKRIGGLNRAATVLNELAEAIKVEKFNEPFLKAIPATTIQRLGYLLEKVVSQADLANHLYNKSIEAGLVFFRIPLKASGKTKGFSSDDKWKVIVNTEIEIDE